MLTCHRLLLAASSSLLSSCLADTDSWPEDRSCVVLPDFTAEEVASLCSPVPIFDPHFHQVGHFLDILYLKKQEDEESSSSSCQLVNFLTEKTEKEKDKQENIKNEEKFKKMPVEVKMEENNENDPSKKISGGSSTSLKVKGPHTCEKCGKTFKLSRILKEHMGLHDAPRFACEVVGCKRNST